MLRARIVTEFDPMNPRDEFDHLGTMVCWHPRYTLGDEQPGGDPDDYFLERIYHDDPEVGEVLERIKERADYGDDTAVWGRRYQALLNLELRRRFIVLPLYLYDHSGLSISTSSFLDPWDSGQVGYILVSLRRVRADLQVRHVTKKVREQVEEILRREVEEYDQYLRGDVWGVVIEEVDDEDDTEVIDDADATIDGEEVDSCWGFFGYRFAREEAERMLADARREREAA